MLHNGIEGKHGVSFKDMNDSFRNKLNNKYIDNDKKVMTDIYNYCAYDAYACRLLW